MNGSHQSSKVGLSTPTDSDAFLDPVQPGGSHGPPQVAFPGTRQLGLVLDLGIEVVRGLPEQAERSPVAGVIPHAGRDHAAVARHARHLAEPGDGVRHEVHDELREGGVERAVVERQVLRRGALDVDLGVALACRRDEGRRGIDGRHVIRSEAADQFCRERAGTTADVEHALARLDAGQIREEGSERRPSTSP